MVSPDDVKDIMKHREKMRKEIRKLLGKNKELRFKSVTIPQFEIKNFCLCDECKDTHIDLALDVIIEIPKDELFDVVSTITLMDEFPWEEVPFEVIIRPWRRNSSKKKSKSDLKELVQFVDE